VVSRGVTLALAVFAAAPGAAADRLDSAIGKRLFERNWVTAPSSTKSDDGLGPLYDAPSCASCHPQQPPADADETTVQPGTVIRLGNKMGAGDPVYGWQLQTRAVAGQQPEANPDITWAAASGGRWKAAIKLYSQHYGPLAKTTKIGLRRAPVVNGVGLLAQIPDSEIEGLAAAQRARNDGVAGAVSYLRIDGKRVISRFGWKATEPDLPSQISIAFSRDIGLSTTRDPAPWGDCTPAESACRAGPHGTEAGEAEVSDTLVDEIAAYLAALPAAEPEAAPKQFVQAACDECHTVLHLADGKPVPAYTDLLLHDLGAGLGDGIKEGIAEPNQWRTAPLWNTAQSLRIGRLLHDGRARTVREAIAWHGGEAAKARIRFQRMSPADQAALVAFVSRL
jgi:CxxC motif-containing protein (DUF1111 family)